MELGKDANLSKYAKQCKMDDLYINTAYAIFQNLLKKYDEENPFEMAYQQAFQTEIKKLESFPAQVELEESKEVIEKIVQEAKTLNPNPFYN